MREAPRDESNEIKHRSVFASKYRLEILSNSDAPRLDMGLALVTLDDTTYGTWGTWDVYIETPNLPKPDKSKFNIKLKDIANNLATTQLPNIPNLDRDALGIADERYAVAIARSLSGQHPDLADTFLRDYSESWAAARDIGEPQTLAEENYNRLRAQLTKPEEKRSVRTKIANILRKNPKDSG